MKKRLLLFFITTLFFQFAIAQGGLNDFSFNTNDNVVGDATGFNYNALTMAVQDDGKIIYGGVFTTYNGIPTRRIARLNQDGSLDTTFNIGSGFDITVSKILLQSDGKILVSGSFQTYNAETAPSIIRLNSDGSKDYTFNVGGGASLPIRSMALQPDGKIIVVGDFITFNGQACNRMTRLNPDGSIDPTFIVGEGCNGTIETVTLEAGGKILIGGNFTVCKN